MFPVRCYTCNTVIAHVYPEYARRRIEKEGAAEILADRGVTRMCCRRMFISHVDLVSHQRYPNKDKALDEGDDAAAAEPRHPFRAV